MDSKRTVDLTLFLTNDVCIILSNAGKKALDGKNQIIDEDHIFYALLLLSPQIQGILQSSAQLQSSIARINEKIKKKEKWKNHPDKLLLSKQVRLALMASISESLLLKEELVSPIAFFLALSKANLTGISYESLVTMLHVVEGVTLNTGIAGLPESVRELTSNDYESLKQYIERANVIDQLIRMFYKDNKKNIFLVGNEGIGKAATSFLLAKKAIENNNIFNNSRVFTVDASKVRFMQVNEILAGLQQVTHANATVLNKVIIYILNADVGASESYKDTSIITPFFEGLFHSEFYAVIPLTYSQYQNVLKTFNAFLTKSEVIYMDEPDLETTKQIIRAKYSSFTEITLLPDTQEKTITLAKRYTSDKFLPESVISLLDEAISQARIDAKKEISINDIKNILSQKTGIPLTDLTEAETSDLQNLEAVLSARVIGQKEAVLGVAKTIKRSRAGLKDPKRPIGSFLFVGPSGTGKTQLAKALAKILYKDENAMIRLDMSEYTDSHTVDRLIGAPPGYIGYEEGGQLTNKVLKKPYSLILLDEVEKANPKVFDIFLQVLDDGRLTDGQGRTVDFKNTVIIMTSNLIDNEKLKTFFRPEFLNRIDQIIEFKPLTFESGKAIVRLFLKELQERLLEKEIEVSISEEVIASIANEGLSDVYGARPLKRLIEEKIEDPIVEKIISGEIKPGQKLLWNKL